MKRIKQVNGYAIYQAATQRDADNHNCQVGNYNIYIAQDIRDFGLSNCYPEYEDLETLTEALNICNASQYAIACALADELSSSTVQDMDLCLEIERRLERGDSVEGIRDCYDPETGRLYGSVSEAIAAGYEPFMDELSTLDSDPYGVLNDSAEGFDPDGLLDEDDDEWDDDDVDPDQVIEDLAAGKLDDAPRSHASYAVLQDPDDGQYYTVAAPSSAELDTQERRDDWLLLTVAKHIAFSDCGGYDVVEVVVDGRRVEYSGWQPGMLIEFVDCETGEFVWDCCRPDWDH